MAAIASVEAGADAGAGHQAAPRRHSFPAWRWAILLIAALTS